MRICRAEKIIFIHNQKTGGMSVDRWLRERCPSATLEGHRHQTAKEAATAIGLDDWNRHYSFGFVRNPWARLVSWWSMVHEHPKLNANFPLWKYIREKGPTFEEFILHCVDPIKDGDTIKSLVRPQLHYFTDDNGELLVDFIGRYEHLQKEVDLLATHLKIPAVKLSMDNASHKPKNFRKFYSEETKKLVAERFAPDIETFGYSFDGRTERPKWWLSKWSS